MAKLSKRSIEALEGVHPALVRVIHEAITATPVDFTVVHGVRTTEEQQALYAQGRTAPGPKVTNADGVRKRSNHQTKADGFGYAVDLYPYYDGSVQVNAPRHMFEAVAEHIKLIAEDLDAEIVWGGDWRSFPDAPHFELIKP